MSPCVSVSSQDFQTQRGSAHTQAQWVLSGGLRDFLFPSSLQPEASPFSLPLGPPDSASVLACVRGPACAIGALLLAFASSVLVVWLGLRRPPVICSPTLFSRGEVLGTPSPSLCFVPLTVPEWILLPLSLKSCAAAWASLSGRRHWEHVWVPAL